MSTYEEAVEAAAAAVSDYVRSSSLDPAAQLSHCCAAVGPVRELEKRLKRHYGARYALCVSNASTGLLAVGLAAGLRRSDIITTPITYGATVAGMMTLGNRPVFADVDPETLTLCPASARDKITAKTSMLLAVDAFGVPADTRALRELADEYGLWYVSDSSQSFGARRDGLPAGALADAVVVSFAAGKSLFAGEGGAVVTSNAALYEKLLWYTQHPLRQLRELGLGLDNEFGLNGRISPAAAVWANAMFEASLGRLRRRQEVCFGAVDALNASGLTQRLDYRGRGIEPSFYRLTAAWAGRASVRRLRLRLNTLGLATEIEPIPARLLYRQAAFLAQFGRSRWPVCRNAEAQFRKRFCLALES